MKAEINESGELILISESIKPDSDFIDLDNNKIRLGDFDYNVTNPGMITIKNATIKIEGYVNT